MIFPLVSALVFTLATLLLVVPLALVQALRKRPQGPLWRRALWLHAGLFLVHLFVTFPVLLGFLGSRVFIRTRPPDQPYAGPRLDADGALLVQDTASLKEEAAKGVSVPPAVLAAAAARAHHVPSTDGVTLRVFRLESREPRPRAIAVLVHGLFRCGVELEPVAGMLRDLGCECWLVELRNHGGSTRAPFTGGLHESDDVLAAVAYARAHAAAPAPLLLYGVSLGTVAISLALPRIDGVAGVVLDSPIDDLDAAARRMLDFHRADDRRTWFRVFEPLRSMVILSLGAWSGFRLDAVAPTDVLATLPVDLPMLVIGGGNDDRAPPATVQRLFDRLPMPPERRELWIEPEGGHGDLAVHQPEHYRECLTRLLERLRR